MTGSRVPRASDGDHPASIQSNALLHRIGQAMPTEWFYELMNDIVGPMTAGELLERVRSGDVKPETPVRKDDSQWVPAEEIGGLFEAAHREESAQICPYCGSDVAPPPTTCSHCHRHLHVSLIAQRDVNGRPASRPKPERRQVVSGDRAEIIRYATYLVLWVALLFAAPYLIYLASSGQLFFEKDLAYLSAVGVSVVIGLLYYWMARLS